MTAVIPPVAPSAKTPHAPVDRATRLTSGRRLPLARLAPARVSSTAYGLCALGRHGRIGDRSLLSVLNWLPGTRVDLLCGLAAGDRLLLVADPSDGLLVLYPPSVLDDMVSGFRAFLAGGERP